MGSKENQNLQFFEAESMRELYDKMKIWEEENKQSLQSISIQNDQGEFCCIALTKARMVVIGEP